MPMPEVYLRQLCTVANETDPTGAPDLSDDALVYAGSATWEMWQNHVPGIVRSMWPLFDEEARLAVYLTAKAMTNYKS